MKLIHKIKLFIARKRGIVANVKEVKTDWQLPQEPKKIPIEIPKPFLKQSIDSTQNLKQFITTRKLFLEDHINLIENKAEKQIMDEEYQQLEKIEEVLWPLIKD